MHQRTLWLATAAVALSATPAVAQPAPPPPTQNAPTQNAPAQRPATPPAAPPNTVGEVRVEGTAPPVRTSIDRQSYSITNDLQATTGSIADALRNVPSVEVDVQGNVSLRGDSNVQILVDGKPSGMFRGDGRGQALQNLPADRIERVEVITNPTAAFDPNGAAGIINLVTKKTKALGYTASVRANLGSMGRWNVGASGSRNQGRFTAAGDINFRRDSIKQEVTGRRETADAALGGVRRAATDSVASGLNRFANGRVGLDFDADARTRISLELRGLAFDFGVDDIAVFNDTGPSGALLRGYDRFSRIDQQRANLESTLSYRWKKAEDHELYMSFAVERQDDERDRFTTTNNRAPTPFAAFEDIRFDGLNWRTGVKVDWSQPMPGESKLKLGYALDADDNDYDNRGFRGLTPTTLTPDASLTNLFKFDQQVHAAYVTYERPMGDFTVLGGLRAEAVKIDLENVTQAIKADNDYVRLYPSLHLSHKLSDTQQIRASYSRRIQRPNPQDYNPFRIFQDPQNFRAGNPGLKPQTTDQFEAGYNYRKQGTFLNATLYYSDVRDSVNDVTRDIGGGVFLTTRENIGESRSAGVSLGANGRVTKKLTYNLGGNVFWTQIDGTGLGFGSRKRDAVTAFGRASLSWQATDKDFFQLHGFMNGKRLTPQGYFLPTGVINLGYRHKFDDRISAVVTVQDVFSTLRDKRVLETPTFRDVQRFEPKQRGVFVGLTWSFGGRQRDPGFDFGGGAPQ